jgi:tRNA(Ile)-lysidine synthase
MLAESVFDQLLANRDIANHWYVGFSGGVDSTVLLYSLVQWRRRQSAPPPLSAIHVNHGLSALAPQWQKHCQRVCARWEVPFLAETVDVASLGGGEAAARDARYAVFESLLGAGQALFLAHHLDDQVETFFLRLLRGAGVEGLAGMPASRSLGRGRLLRPLLDYTRHDIAQIAQQHGLPCLEDPSNANTDIDRNLLRQEVLPLLARRWPAYRRTVSRAASHMADAARERAPAVPLVHSVTGDRGLALAQLTQCEPSDAALRLRAWLRQEALPVPDQSALREFLRQLRGAASSAAPQLATGAYTLTRFAQAVCLQPVFSQPPPSAAPVMPDQPVSIPGVGRMVLAPCEHGIALPAGQSLELRWRQGGETCRPRGRGGATSLKKVLQECAVPPWWRSRVPLLFAGDELLCVAHLVQCESARVPPADAAAMPRWRLLWEPSAR